MIKRPILRVECTVNELKNILPKFFNLQKVRYSDTHLNNSQKPSINQFILHEINNIFCQPNTAGIPIPDIPITESIK